MHKISDSSYVKAEITDDAGAFLIDKVDVAPTSNNARVGLDYYLGKKTSVGMLFT